MAWPPQRRRDIKPGLGSAHYYGGEKYLQEKAVQILVQPAQLNLVLINPVRLELSHHLSWWQSLCATEQ